MQDDQKTACHRIPSTDTLPDPAGTAFETAPHLTRRQGLTTALLAPAFLAAPAFMAGLAAHGAAAQEKKTTMTQPAFAPYYRFQLGGFTVTTLMAGSVTMADPHGTFGTNATDEQFEAASHAAFIPATSAINGFTPTLVDTGSALVLFDTGLQPEGILTALRAAGVEPAAITHVVLTHMHGDHIGGLSTEGTLTFPDASYIFGRTEFDHWATTGNEGFETKVRPLADRARYLADGDTVVPGITAELAPGHTPGHMVFTLESEGAKLTLTADLANHYVWSLGYPDWNVRFDSDNAQANASRRRILTRLAEERTPFVGHHMPFPAVGFIEAVKDHPAGAEFRFVPASYQLQMGTKA